MSVTESVTTQFSDATDVATAVVSAVASTTDSRIEELPPLYDVIDPDALNGVFERRPNAPSQSGVRVTFSIADCTVTVTDGSVTVVPSSDPAAEPATPAPVQH